VKALLALLAAGKLGKFFISGGTMLLSVVTYAFVFGWWYAVGFVALLFAHEMGHFIAAKNRGLSVGLPTFIPFVGAWIQLKEQPMDSETEAFVGIAGPMLGTAASFACYLAAEDSGSRLLLALSYAGFVLNLFNLIPLSPFDGGRIVGVISTRIWYLGIPILAGLFLWSPSPFLLIIVILLAPQIWHAFKTRKAPDDRYYQTPNSVRINYGLQYLALAGFLAVMSYEIHERLGNVAAS